MTAVEPSWPAHLPAAWQRAASSFPQKGILFYDRRGRPGSLLTYGAILERLRAGAGRFRRLEIEPDDRVLVCLPTSLEWLEVWFGVLFAGGIPVAVAPPEALGSAAAVLEKIEYVAEQVGARWLVCGGTLPAAIEEGTPGLQRIVLPVEKWRDVEPRTLDRDPDPDPDATAFLQLTSGSTGRPRAVMISHRAVIANNVGSAEAIGAPFGAPAWEWADSLVSWLPLHHDMGLVGGISFSVVNGFDLHLSSPRAFLGRPRTWLEMLSGAGNAISPAPNFGYQLTLERHKPGDLEGLSLSNWKTALFGAEMVRPQTVRAFSEAFAPAGFEAERARPCYGMAETTLAVSFDCAGEGLRTRPITDSLSGEVGLEEVPSNGAAIRGMEMQVVSPDGSVIDAGRVGHVCVRGTSLFQGYFNDEEATREVLRDGWLWTGDLGFLERGEIYLTGRSKEILILRGNNVMPHELEWVVEELSAAGGSRRVGAFSIPHPSAGEEAVLVVEVRDTEPARLRALENRIRVEIGRRQSVVPADVVFVRRGRIPRTTSGKVQRRELRSRYLEQRLERLSTQ